MSDTQWMLQCSVCTFHAAWSCQCEPHTYATPFCHEHALRHQCRNQSVPVKVTVYKRYQGVVARDRIAEKWAKGGGKDDGLLDVGTAPLGIEEDPTG